jgi:hypothetical protein
VTEAVARFVESVPPEIDRQIRARKIELPAGGHARIRGLDAMTARQQRPMQLLGARVGDVLEKLPHARRLYVDGDLIEDRTDAKSFDTQSQCYGSGEPEQERDDMTESQSDIQSTSQLSAAPAGVYNFNLSIAGQFNLQAEETDTIHETEDEVIQTQ